MILFCGFWKELIGVGPFDLLDGQADGARCRFVKPQDPVLIVLVEDPGRNVVENQLQLTLFGAQFVLCLLVIGDVQGHGDEASDPARFVAVRHVKPLDVALYAVRIR